MKKCFYLNIELIQGLRKDFTMMTWDERCLLEAIEVAACARKNGNHPFGAVLADDKGVILLKAENTVITDKDVSGHAETNLVRLASKKFDHAFLAKCTIYASTEPCPMCVGAIFWANVRRVVFGLSEERLYEMTGDGSEEVFYYPCKELFQKGKKKIEVIGPVLESQALKVHKGFWK